MHPLPVLLVAGAALAAALPAQIVYVDADPATNTTLATGAAFVPNPATSGIDNNWSLRLFANGATVYESHSAATSNEDAPMLRTTLTGLVPGLGHHIYAYFWGASTVATNWRGRAVVAPAAPTPQIQGYNTRQPATSLFLPMTPLGTGAPVGVQQTSLGLAYDAVGMETSGHFANPVMIQEGNRWLYEVSLGVHVPNANGEVTVWLDDLEGAVNSDSRTWYDGLGWELAPLPLGTGCGSPIPQIGAIGAPIMTRDFTVTLANAPANGIGLLVIGFSSTSWNGLPLPLPLGSLGYPGCDLAVSLDLTQVLVTSPAGDGSLTFNLNGPGPVNLFWQWGVFDAAGGLAMSPGLVTWFHR